MKCPHCGYEHGWNNEDLKEVEGEEGSFWHLDGHQVSRDTYESKRSIWACPRCGICFIEL